MLVWVFGVSPVSIGHFPISFSLSCWNRTYIDRSFIVSVWVSGLHLYRSTIFLSIWVWVFELGPHLYQSVIILSVRVQFESGPHLYRSVIFRVSSSFRGCTYIDRPSSYHLVCLSLSWDRTYIDQSFFMSVSFSLSRGRTYIDRPSFY